MQRDQGPAFGAAILAGVGSGLFADVASACARFVSADEPLLPDAAAAQAYQPYFELYKSLYPLLKPSFEQLTALA